MTLAPHHLRFLPDRLEGPLVARSEKKVVDLVGIFRDDAARAAAEDRLAYSVYSHVPQPEGTPGGLCFGISRLEPGTVGGECVMTRGHFHAVSDRPEYYWGIAGSGLLLLMTRDRKSRVERVEPGSLHFIPGHTAHRLINTGDVRLDVGACWPSDAGYEYDSIARDGFSLRVFRRDGVVQFEDVG